MPDTPPLSPLRQRRLWFGAACALLIFAALSFAFAAEVHPLGGGYIRDADMLARGALALLAAGLIFGLSLRGVPPLPEPDPLPRPAEPPISRPLVIGAGALLLLLAEINGQARGVEYVVSQHIQFGLFVFALTALLIGLRAFRRPRIDPAVGLLLLLLMVAGLTLRLWELEDALHYPVDEGHMMDAVATLRADPAVEIFQPFGSVSVFTWLYAYLQSWTSAVWGSTYVGVRIVSVFIGTLTIPALYLLGRALFSRRVGLIAALLLVSFPPHLHFSRLALLNLGDTLFGALAFAFFARGLRTRRSGDYALAGVMLGMTQYFYEGGRLLYPAVMLAWLALLILSPRRMDWRGLARLALAAALTALPFYYTWVSLGLPLATKLARYTADAPLLPGALLDNHLTPVVSHFVSKPDGDPFYYGGSTPLLLLYTAVPFLLSVCDLIWRGRWRAGSLLLLTWLAGMIFGGSLLADNTWTARYVAVFPALALMVALGVSESLRLRRSVAVYGLALLISVGQAFYYFNDHLPLVNVQVRAFNQHDHLDALFRTAALPPETQVVMIVDHHLDGFDMGQVRRYRPDLLAIQIMQKRDLSPLFFADFSPDQPRAIFIEQDDAQTRAMIESILSPQPPQMSIYNVPPDMQFLLYFIPAR